MKKQKSSLKRTFVFYAGSFLMAKARNQNEFGIPGETDKENSAIRSEQIHIHTLRQVQVADSQEEYSLY